MKISQKAAVKEKTQETNNSQNSSKCNNNNGNIKVVCRVRPPNKNELLQYEQGKQQLCIDFYPDEKTIKLNMTEQEKHQFTFDRIFGSDTTQQAIYEFSAKPVVQSVLEGYNGTVFAYGQTSSGKTHTMQGPSINDQDLKGIIPRMVTTVFQHVHTSPNHIEFKVKVSIVEIYLEKIKDLLDPSKVNLTVREDRTNGVYIQDVTEKYVTSEKEVFNIIDSGNQNRSVAFTNMNEGSSRSHMLFIMTIYQNNLQDLSAKSGKLFLVDLAGSEKIAKTGAEGKTLDEAKRINQSLSCLGNVINALTDGKSNHIPYRDSKLTRVLQESLGGNSTTTLIITCSPSSFNDQETLSTLRFGMRAKSIKNKPKINREYTIQELQLLLQNQEKIIDEQKKTIRQLEKQIQNGNYANTSQNQANSENINSQLDSSMDNIEPEQYTMTIDRTMELEAQLEAEKIKCESYAKQLSQAQNEFSNIASQMETFSSENEIMSNKLTNLAFTLNDLETEMINNKFNMEKSQCSKQQIMQQISSFRKINQEYKNQFSGSLNCNLNQNQHIIDLVGDDVNQINKDILLICQTKLSQEEFKLFLNQMIVQKNKNEDNVSNCQYQQLQQELEEERQLKLQIQKELEDNKQENSKLLKIQEQLQTDLSQKNSFEGTEANKELNEIQLSKERQQFKLAKEKILEDLRDKVNNVLTLENELENQKQIAKKFEDELSKKEQNLQFKVEYLEKNLERMTTMYENLVSKALLEKGADQQNKKLKKKQQKIEELEQKLNDSQNKVSKFKKQTQKSTSQEEHIGDLNHKQNKKFLLNNFMLNENYDYNDTDKSEINNSLNSSEYEQDYLDSSSDSDLDENIIKQIDSSRVNKQSERNEHQNIDEQKNLSIFYNMNKSKSNSTIGNSPIPKSYKPKKVTQLHLDFSCIQKQSKQNNEDECNDQTNDHHFLPNNTIQRQKSENQTNIVRSQYKRPNEQRMKSYSQHQDSSIDYNRVKLNPMTYEKIEDKIKFDIEEVDDDNMSEEQNNMNNSQYFAFGNKNSKTFHCQNNQQYNDKNQYNNIISMQQSNIKQLPVKAILNAQGLNLTQCNANYQNSTFQSSRITYTQNTRRKYDESLTIGGQTIDDNDYYNILKSQETEPNPFGSDTNLPNLTQMNPKSPSSNKEQQTFDSPKNMTLQDYMMNQQKSMIQDLIHRKNTTNFNSTQINTTETTDTTKTNINNNNKKMTPSDILRGNPALSPFINTFSFKLLNLQTNCIYSF